ncbi:helix-turn-helix domain-containing protein [Halococcus sp. AFM35]|uniref:helix-turn-helix domain-containing protein n=1 Tax=Halococcus sp. AFM35 TaxID=3421653 RepID=UPI003EB87BD7
MVEQISAGRSPTPQLPSLTGSASTARFQLPADRFAFARLFERIPNVRIECEATVANPADHALVVIRTEESEEIDPTLLRDDPAVAAVDCFSERSDGIACRVTWKGRPHRLIQQLTAADVTLLSLHGSDGVWKLRVLAPDRKGIKQADEILNELGCNTTCENIGSFNGGEDSMRLGLTDDQREALLTAFEMHYYDIPRGAHADDVADELGISHQALSERLRRAYEGLIATKFSTND